MEMGSHIRKKRIEKGYSQEYLSDILNISQAKLSNIEAGKSIPDINLLLKIGKELEIDFTTILNPENKEILSSKDDVIVQLSSKIIELYETRIKEKEETIKNLRNQLNKYQIFKIV